MAVIWFTNFAILYRPEDSFRLADEKFLLVPAFRSVNAKSTAPVKALVWTMISIMAGLIIGQLS